MNNSSYRSNNNGGSDERAPAPYELVRFPDKPPSACTPPGHDKYLSNCLHGTLFLTLQVQTALHVSTGVAVMGSDIDKNGIPLIKTMEQGVDKTLLIPGSSLKGCIRAIYEAITNSRLGVKPTTNKPPDRLPARRQNEICPAGVVFGASGDNWGWQGLINIRDARCNTNGFGVGYMPALWSPKPHGGNYYHKGQIAGRKFYYHMVRALDKGEKDGIRVQQASRNYTFSTQIHFRNLQSKELGALLIALGQDSNYPFALKLGAGKPIGMGTMIVKIPAVQVMQNQDDLCKHYKSFSNPDDAKLEGKLLQQFILQHIQAAHNQNLIEKPQLEQLSQILTYPSTRQPYDNY
ncbi:MAG: RAMP superfamily CRISPR-associated protein [Fischerella sp. CENA71]|nr:RAMP superfamily CRISPR-associated protein [Fischerella sp. CENA71]